MRREQTNKSGNIPHWILTTKWRRNDHCGEYVEQFGIQIGHLVEILKLSLWRYSLKCWYICIYLTNFVSDTMSNVSLTLAGGTGLRLP